MLHNDNIDFELSKYGKFINSHICILIELYVQIFPRVRFNYSKIPVCLVFGSKFHNFFHWRSIKTNIQHMLVAVKRSSVFKLGSSGRIFSSSDHVVWITFEKMKLILLIWAFLCVAIFASSESKAGMYSQIRFDSYENLFFFHEFFLFPRILDEICSLPPAPGTCYALIQKWYYEPSSSSCKRFGFGGCGGNANKFSTKEDCERSCGTGKYMELTEIWRFNTICNFFNHFILIV